MNRIRQDNERSLVGATNARYDRDVLGRDAWATPSRCSSHDHVFQYVFQYVFQFKWLVSMVVYQCSSNLYRAHT